MKKFLSILALAFAALFASAQEMSEGSSTTPMVVGDANGDGSITVADAMTMVTCIMNDFYEEINFTNADINGDGKINVTDVMAVVRIIVNGPAAPDLKVTDTVVELPKGQNTVDIISGSGSYEVTSSNPDLVEATLDGTKVFITCKIFGAIEITPITNPSPAKAKRNATADQNVVVTIKDQVTKQTMGFNVRIAQSYLSCPDNNHPHMIDLGLPSGTKWACCNVGAYKPERDGGYYAWGETKEKDCYDWSTYDYCDKTTFFIEDSPDTPLSNCFNIGENICGTEFDVAHVEWGGLWKMPNVEEAQELAYYCTYEFTTENGIAGGKLTGPNGASIFLPASGNRYESKLLNLGNIGYYWVGIPSHNSYFPGDCMARTFCFDPGDSDNNIVGFYCDEWLSYPRLLGFSVRPIVENTLQLSTSHVEIDIDEEEFVDITSGSGNYTVVSSNEEVVDIYLDSNNRINIYGLSDGVAYITVTDTKTGQTATIKVTVGEVISLQLSITNVEIDVDEEIMVEIISGSGNYTVESSDDEVVDVFLDKKKRIYIYGVSEGTATVTVSDTNTEQTATIQVTVGKVKSICSDNNHPHMIDLGLPSGIKWACCNVGANNPEGHGGYYAWGETNEEMKTVYDWSSYTHCDGTAETCHDIGESICGTENDVAYKIWGNTWQMPTLNHMKEILSFCSYEPAILNGIYGFVFISKNNGNKLFLPASGYRSGSELENLGSEGCYWSGSLDSSFLGGAYDLSFYKEGFEDGGPEARWEGNYYRYDGQSVRPVTTGETVYPLALASHTMSLSYPDAGIVRITSGNGSYTATTSNSLVASVTIEDSYVRVTPVSPGTATITVKDTQTEQTATIEVTTVLALCPDNNHPHMIDLGLPSGTIWSCCNVGANKPEGYGGYYAWGETNDEVKAVYDWSSYTFCDGTAETCHDIGENISATEFDVAYKTWGSEWQMPTAEQMAELTGNCTYIWTTLNGINGGLFVSKENGKHIFLPAAGSYSGSQLTTCGSIGNYWASTRTNVSFGDSANALEFYSGGTSNDYGYTSRYIGKNVRPVKR